MDRLQAMQVFVRVLETGSFSAAARDLKLGQPAVSKIVAALEARLGVRLLVRSTHQLTPTDAGQSYYEKARRVVIEADEAEIAAKSEALGLEGRLRVCAPVTFARLHIAPKLASFLEAHPKLTLELFMDDRNVDLLAENIDVALRLGQLSDSGLTARKLAEAKRHVVASPAYLARHGTPKSPAELVAHNAIVYTRISGGTQWRFRQGTSEISVNVASRLACTAAEGVREAVIAGLGFAIVSNWMMQPELASGVVTPILSDWSLPAIALWAVFPSGRLPSAKARAFVNWFEATIADAAS
jgi:DNA-binding transcriptional LysR family regulator